ncbi:MAG: hypothetical protein ACI959_000356 [Limisphaerales bacterium]|jgi:hypothetical protein
MIRSDFFILIALSVVLCACGTKAEDGVSVKKAEPTLSTDVINNPKTLEDGEVVLTDASLPQMTFERDKYDFGEIIQGEGREYSFKFTNTGESDLIISTAKGSCGCTVPDWPKEPIAPGASSYIRVTYDSKGRKDLFNKTVTITANTNPNSNKLYISGLVIVPES